MTAKKVTIQWGTKVYNREVDENETCKQFMTTLSELTGVEAGKMKVMGIGGLLKPTQDTLKSRGLKDNQKVMMIGHLASKAVTTPCGPITKFVEDLTKEERMKMLNEVEQKPLPVGIQNLGVTCYLNSCMQMINAIKPIREQFIEFGNSRPSALGPITKASIASDIAKLMVDLGGGLEAPSPLKLISSMRQCFPELARKSSSGPEFMQQDVDEFWHYLVSIGDSTELGGQGNPLHDEFRFQMRTTITFDSSAEGQTEVDDSIIPPKITDECAYKLTALMGSATQPISLVQQSLKLSLETEITKRVIELDDQSFKFKSKQTILSLPNYLNLHFVRFEWKRNADGGARTKVTRKIAFSNTFDLFDFCDDELKKQIQPARCAFASEAAPKVDDDTDMESEEDPEVTYPDGSYSLIGIITHEGRTADSGHYVAWRKKHVDDEPKQKEQRNMWIKFDDDKVSEHSWDTLDLQGGRGDFHMAYLTFWKQNTITVKKSVYDKEVELCINRHKMIDDAKKTQDNRSENDEAKTPVIEEVE
eukprot:GHVH01001474.1.p1 GENE.GHVH01001474.1~~GHVH01001474.1.p1  ORF type:complete len:532 (-),score=100.52 GHVH01001474.1:79-1674(-)